MPARLSCVLVLLLSGLCCASATAAAPTPLTYRQSANAICQDFYAHAPQDGPVLQRAHEPWRHARRRLASALRRMAAQNLAMSRRLAAVARPRRVEANWDRLVATARSAARHLLRTSRRLERARSRQAVDGIFFRGLFEGYGRTATRFRGLARAMRLAGCGGLDPTVDIGRDLTASARDRAAAVRFGRIGSRVLGRVTARTPVIVRGVRTVLFHGSCGRMVRAVTDAPKRAERTADEVLGLAILRAELRPVRGAMRAFARSIRQVHPTDPVLAKGGVTLAPLAREIAVLGDSPNRCADLEAWQRAGWPRGGGPRVHTLPTSSAKEDRRIRAELFRLGRRLRALGAPAAGVRPLMLTNLFGLSDALTAAATLGPIARREAPAATSARALLGR